MKLLVCLDDGEQSRSILPVARRFACTMGAEVEMVRVIDPRGSHSTKRRVLVPDPYPGIDLAQRGRMLEQQVVEDQGRAFAGFEARTADDLSEALAGFPPGSGRVILHGEDPAKKIVHYVEGQGIDVVAMATHSRRRVAGLIWGSTTTAVIASGVAPVLVVHGALPNGSAMSRMMVCLDGSPLSTSVLPLAQRLANRSGVAAHLVHVVDVSGAKEVASQRARGEPPMVDPSGGLLDRRAPGARVGEGRGATATLVETRSEAIDRLEYGVQETLTSEQSGFPSGSTSVVLHGRNAAAEILRYARVHEIGLIVMATHARRGFRRVVVGSAAEAVIRAGVAPVLVWHPRS
ncbi:MAG: universal stress protein [Dehalococcoidia bacterium]